MSEHIATGGIFGKDANAVRRDLIREMNRLGIYRVEGEYSGGHDEGGLDQLACYDKDNKIVDLPGGYDHPLHRAVDDLLNTKFYSWALGMSVYGHVYVDLKQKRAWTEGSQEEMNYTEDPDPIDMSW